MKIGELIKMLQSFPEEMLVTVDGYEEGQDDLTEENIKIMQLRDDVSSGWWSGRYEEDQNGKITSLNLGR